MSRHTDATHDQKPITMRVVTSEHEEFLSKFKQILEENIRLQQRNMQLLIERDEAMKKIAGLEKMLAAYVDRSHRQEKEIERLFSQLFPTNLPNGVIMATPTQSQPLPASGIIQPNN